jgi:hypothetical protein
MLVGLHARRSSSAAAVEHSPFAGFDLHLTRPVQVSRRCGPQ